MNDGESYRFDISGFIVVRGVLSSEELANCNKAFEQTLDGDRPCRDPFTELRDHPVLAKYVEWDI